MEIFTKPQKSILKFFMQCILGICVVPAFSQKTTIIDDFKYGLTYYEGFSITIDSLSAMPDGIIKSVSDIIKMRLGNLSTSVRFSHGQIVDVKNYYKKNSLSFTNHKQIPKYDLEFILQDTIIGIKSHSVRIKIDEYGQVLYCNWPTKGYSDKNKFKSFSEIEKYALQVAAKKGFNTSNYMISFNYNDSQNKMCWEFQFRKVGDNKNGFFDALEIDSIGLDIIDEYEVKKQTVN
jgi:hypothetical protein